jgi:SAM-dependent methyltransferase
MLENLLRLPGVGSAYWHFKWKARPVNKPKQRLQNGVLQSRSEWESALTETRELGLPPHQDPPKNWDSLAALSAILERTTPTARVLDAGAAMYSAILPWLASYGYRNLTGINLEFKRTVHVGPIAYEHGDITETRFPDASFDVITSLSVIEHNVDVGKFMREAARLLAPGGLLVLSTDYFDPRVDTGGAVAYGGPIRVFDAKDVTGIVDNAREYGLVPTTEVGDLRCDEKCVTWNRYKLSFTFLLLTFEKR